MKKSNPVTADTAGGKERSKRNGPSARVTDFLKRYARAARRVGNHPDSAISTISLN